MKSLAIEPFVLGLALLLGCEANPDPPSPADGATGGAVAENGVLEEGLVLTNRVWVRADSTGMPGVLRLFLVDGTLLMDSCWETYRLSEWSMTSDSTLRWQEDSAEIRANVLTMNEEELVLRLNLTSGAEDQRFVSASVPYVCPEMPR
ncbi:MAG: hypothetical protein ACR2GR_09775 [Rhodothermales bacterium]